MFVAVNPDASGQYGMVRYITTMLKLGVARKSKLVNYIRQSNKNFILFFSLQFELIKHLSK